MGRVMVKIVDGRLMESVVREGGDEWVEMDEVYAVKGERGRSRSEGGRLV